MKLKTVYSSIALIFLVVGVALWKLNDTYRAEKSSVRQNQLQTQLTALRSSLVSQISQLRNTLSAYTVQIDESKINWVQLKPFYALGVVQEDGSNRLTVNKLFLQSGSAAERWNSSTVQLNLADKITGNQLLRVQTFKDSSGLVHLALIVFDKEKRNNQPRSGVLVVGDVSYFQRFFDLQRTSAITQVLMTLDKKVAAHSEYEYVGNKSDENKIGDENFFVDRQELRGTNLVLLSYTSKKAGAPFDIPLPILGIILGLGFLMSGILLYVAKPEIAAARAQKVKSHYEEESDANEEIGFAPPVPQISTPAPQPLKATAKEPPPPKPMAPPIDLSGESQVVSIQVQASVQQALFNIDRQLKSQGVTVKKEFVSGESVQMDYPRFIKIFENVLLTIAQQLTGKKKIQLRSYDDELQTVLEIQAQVQEYTLHPAILPELVNADAEFSQVASSAGEAIFRFTFTRSESSKQAAVPVTPVTKTKAPAQAEVRFELSDDDMGDLKLAPVPAVNPVQNDLDIDALLSLDDDGPSAMQATPVKAEEKIEKEMQPAKFKLDEKMSIVEDPEINIAATQDNKADKTKVKIRRPEKG